MLDAKVHGVDNCRVCGKGDLLPILSLGELYVSDFLDESKLQDAKKAPLDLVLCDVKSGGCGLLQSKYTVDHEALYRNYWYRSGVNKTMRDELSDIVGKVESVVSLAKDDYVIDTGSNDSTLLRAYKTQGVKTIGFEPARNIVEKYGRDGVTNVFTDFFGAVLWKKEYGGAKAKVITSIAMFYDLEEPNVFVGDIAKCLDMEGVWIVQMSYLPFALERNAFDGICHEHLEYYSLYSLENLLRRHGLEVFDVELRDINEGSFRVFVRHKGGGTTLRISPEAEGRVRRMREEEEKLGLDDKKIYEDFAKRVEAIKGQVADFINKETASGKKVYVYGASTKGNTLLQYFGLDHKVITAAAERNPDKWGKKTVGTHIPIIPEETARLAKADYFLVLPWHFLKEFREREREYLKGGGKFIVPLPEFKIIDEA